MYGLVLAGAALLVAVLATSRRSSGASPFGLSPVRRRALQILDELLPAAYPDSKFRKIVGAGWTPASTPGATTCGALPMRMGYLLGDPHGITRGGVPGVEAEGRVHGAWVEASEHPGRRPKPGDIYLLAFPDGAIAHTGVIENANGDVWTTADAGQGPASSPRAEYVERRWDPKKGTLTRLDNGESRVLVGWIDLDRWPFPPAAVAKRLRVRGEDQLWNPWPLDPGESGR